VIGAQRRALCTNARLHYELVRIGKTTVKWNSFWIPSAPDFSARVRDLGSNFGAVETQTLFRMPSKKC
jgi:hypothetical protein